MCKRLKSKGVEKLPDFSIGDTFEWGKHDAFWYSSLIYINYKGNMLSVYFIIE